MKSRAFAYWLQGHFELTESADKPLDIQQMSQIRTKLATVTDNKADMVAGPMVSYLRGVFDAMSLLPLVQQQEASAELTKRIRKLLNDNFEHAIDPTIPGDQAQHRRTHRPDDDGGPKIVAMC